MSSVEDRPVEHLKPVPPRTRDAAFVAASEDPIIGLTPEGEITSWNPAAERLYGYSVEEAVGRSIAMLVPPELRGRANLLATVRAGGSVHQYETQRLAKDGRRVEVSISMSPIRDESGAVVAAVAFTRDNTAHKERERQLLASEARLEEAQALAQIGSWQWDIAANKTTWSDELYRISGTAHVTPNYEGFLERVHPDDLEMFAQAIERALTEATPFALDHRIVRPDGSIKVLASRGQVVTDDAGRVIRMSATAQDITERHALERMKNEFISVVSHELRTPLTSIRGSLGLLAGGVLGPLPEKGQQMLDIAVRSTDRLVRLINDILDIERIESGAETMRREVVSASDLMDQARHAVQATADQAGLTLSVSASPLSIEVDPDRIVQTLINLLSNAIKFSEPGNTVWLRAKHSHDGALFTVEDDGRGIPADKLNSIFERFNQVDGSDSREKGGTGLGLAICRSIVGQHGGRIWVDSEVGEGSKFSFVIPVEDDHVPSLAAGVVSGQPT